MTDDRLLLYGTDEAEPTRHVLAAGPLSFELVHGNIRDIRFGGIEVLRGIEYLFRDADWGTLAPTISDLTIDRSCGVHVAYRASCCCPDGARLDYRATIAATPSSLDFSVEAEALDDVTTNRLGFCTLHSAALAGVAVRVEHGDGTAEVSRFPQLIDPWQPFTDIRALTYMQEGVTTACRFEGDSFEMEDQRNWSDASYKTYVRPLARPWPYVIPQGTRDRQAVSLHITGKPPPAPVADGPIIVTIGDAIGAMPRIGLVIAADQAPLAPARAEALATLGVQDLLLSIDPSSGHGAAEMAALACAAAGSSARRTLECVIPGAGDPAAELGAVARHVEAAGLVLDGIAVFPKPDLQSTPPGSAWPACPPPEAIYTAARRAFPTLLLGGGMFSYFTELNRKRVPADRLDFISHATCPIVHAADDRSVMQSLEVVPHILASMRAIYPDVPYRLGPVTIGMRQNPYGSRTMPNPLRQRTPMATFDPRQDGRFAAAWTIGYAAATEGCRLDTLTLGALTGPLGVMGESGFRPVAAAVRALAALAGRPRRACVLSRAGEVAAICAGPTLLLANLTATPRQVVTPAGTVELDALEVVTVG